MKKALFLDRDGVINKEINYLHKSDDFVFIDGVFETCKDFQKAGYLIIIITNQAGIGRGYYTRKDFEILNEWMLNQFNKMGICISDVYYCPHHPENGIGEFKMDCPNRKPNPGMIFQAKEKFNIDLKKSILVGDKESDILCGKNAGVGKSYLVKTGHPFDAELTEADGVFDSILDIKSLLKK